MNVLWWFSTVLFITIKTVTAHGNAESIRKTAYAKSVFRCIYLPISYLLNQTRHPTHFEGKWSPSIHLSKQAAQYYNSLVQSEQKVAISLRNTTRQGLRGHAFKFHQQRCCSRRRQFAFTFRAVPFWNKLPAEIINASSVKSFKALLDARWQSLFPEVPI